MTVVERLAGLVAAQRGQALAPEVVHAATRAVLDWFSATVPGTEMSPARVLTVALTGAGEHGPARLVGSRLPVPVRTAALINATASHTPEMDDIYRDGIYHPGSPTVAAALAVAQQVGASGLDLLRAVVVGYEIGDRVAAVVNPAHYRFWHTTGTVGTLGAAGAAAVLLDLDGDQAAHALATATTMAAGLQQAFRAESMSKPLHAGHAAEAGVLAALAARSGFTGALDVLEGSAGFGAGMSDHPDWDAATVGLGERFRILDATVKNHSCCGHTFAAVDAASDLRRAGLQADDVTAIRVATYATALEVAGNPDPTTVFEAKFSVAYCVAAELVLGAVRFRAFEPEALADPLIRRLVAATTLEVDGDCDAWFPTRRAARVTITDRQGREHHSARDTRKGDPDDPLSDTELQEKFDELVGPVYGPAATATLAERIWGLASLADVRDLDPGRDPAPAVPAGLGGR